MNPALVDPYAAFPPAPASVSVGGETIDITPIKVGELPAFARAVQPVAEHLSTSPNWLALLAAHGEAVITVLALATRRPAEWVQALALDEAVALAEAVFAVNADFFLQRVQPSLTQALARLGQRMPGPTPSSG